MARGTRLLHSEPLVKKGKHTEGFTKSGGLRVD